MPRPPKKRFVCCIPENTGFLPESPASAESVIMTVDEYETVRLIDLEGSTQEECAEQMGISRTTAQGIYDSARKKIADALVNSKRLTIAGGAYVACAGYSKQCGRGSRKCCHRRNVINFKERRGSQYEKNSGNL